MKTTKKMRVARKSPKRLKVAKSLKRFFPPVSQMGIPTQTPWGISQPREKDRPSALANTPDVSM